LLWKLLGEYHFEMGWQLAEKLGYQKADVGRIIVGLANEKS